MAYFLFDTETTGLSSEDDQILEIAGVFTKNNNETIATIEYSLLIKENVKPSPQAMAVNKIDYKSKEWQSKSITELACVERLIADFTKIKAESGSGIFLKAYNAEFDVNFLEAMFLRVGENLWDYVETSSIDPLILTKDAVSSGKIKTIAGKSGKPSAKLEDVARALGVSYSGMGAHRAISDVIVLQKVEGLVRGTYKEFNQSMVSDGDLILIVVNARKEADRFRNVRVLKNDKENHQLIILEEVSAKGSSKKLSISAIPYEDISYVNTYRLSNQLPSLNALELDQKVLFENILTKPSSSRSATSKKLALQMRETKKLASELKALTMMPSEKDPVGALKFKSLSDAHKKEALRKLYSFLCSSNSDLASMVRRSMSGAQASGPEKLTFNSTVGNAEVELHPSGRYICYLNYSIGKKLVKEIRSVTMKEHIFSGSPLDTMESRSFLKTVPQVNDFLDLKSDKVILEESRTEALLSKLSECDFFSNPR